MADNIWKDLTYTDVLQSDGFVTDYAVATTYSLDLKTLLSIPFMIGTMSELSETAMHSPHLILEAIDKARGKFAVFCNAGNIFVPGKANRLYLLLEQNVVQVALRLWRNGFVNFHPKVWVIKESNPDTGAKRIKVVVMSRNLTSSDDLDVVCSVTGDVGLKRASADSQKRHKPLVDFLRWLSERNCGAVIRRNIEAMCEDITKIESFDIGDDAFDDYDFFPMGIDGYDGENTCLRQCMLNGAAEMVIISPFIDEQTMRRFVDQSPKARKTLITRHSSLTNDIINMFNGEAYTVKEMLTDKAEKDVAVDLHEKVYFIRSFFNGETYNDLYIGSTNATKNGFARNVEFLLRLTFTKRRASYDSFRQELINDSKDCMFEQVASVAETERNGTDNEDELYLRKAIDAIARASVSAGQDGCYSLSVHCKKRLPEYQIEINPLFCDMLSRELTDGVTFEGLRIEQLTEFYVIKSGGLRRVVKITTSGFPEKERNDAIFRSIVNSPEKFIDYVAFMLTDTPEQYMLESQAAANGLGKGDNAENGRPVSISLFEDMVRKSYIDPDCIAGIENVVRRAGEDAKPEHFDEMYSQFMKAIKQIKKL